MAWTYNDWRSQATPALQLTRLYLHLDEVSAQAGADVSSGGKSRATQSLNDYIRILEENARRLERITGTNREAPKIIHADLRGRG